MQAGYIRPLPQRFAIFFFGLWHLPEHKVVLTHGLVSPGGVGVCAEQSVDGALGKQTAGTAEVIEQVCIIGTFDQNRTKVFDCLLVLSGLDLSDSQSFQSVDPLEVRNGLGGVSL